MNEGEDKYFGFTADGGNILIYGITGRCPDRECVKKLIRKMIKAPETPPHHIREMAESVLQHFLQMVQEIDAPYCDHNCEAGVQRQAVRL